MLVLALTAFSSVAWSTEYIYRELMGNTIASQNCQAKPLAEQRATEQYTIDKFTKRFCETQGYGWHLSEERNKGQLVCEECSDDKAGKFKCHMEDVVVSCKRIAPGSVGLFPGKG
jgi:hypothetical protein